MKLLFFQHGNYSDAYQTFKSGGTETYRDQRVSVDFVADLSREHTVVTVAICKDPHDVVLAPGLRSIGITRHDAQTARFMKRLLDGLSPDRIICRTPNEHALRWARKNKVMTLPLFADFFTRDGLRTRFANLRFKLLFGADVFPCISNHSLNASVSVSDAFGYSKGKIVPWDWSVLEELPTPKEKADSKAVSLFFAGGLSEVKGIGECLEATRLLLDKGIEARFLFAGPGDIEMWRDRAEALGLGEHAVFLGSVPHPEVRRQMSACDVIVVPSRHEYPEGLPNTIYEGLASRSPIIISDHPAYTGRLLDGQDCLVFAAANPDSLARSVVRMISEPGLYQRLSENALQAHRALYIGLEWAKLITLFLKDPHNESGWVEDNSLEKLEYHRGYGAGEAGE